MPMQTYCISATCRWTHWDEKYEENNVQKKCVVNDSEIDNQMCHWTHKEYQKFLWRKRICSACSGVSALLCAVIMSPAVEKTLSAETLVPGMHKYLFARFDRRGYSHSCSFHQFSGLELFVIGIEATSLNLPISSAAWFSVVLRLEKNAWTSNLKWCNHVVCPAEGSLLFIVIS